MIFPKFLRKKLPAGSFLYTETLLKDLHLNTVCEEAKCPNKGECFAKQTATFLALGKKCTRHCSFCDIAHSPCPDKIDEKEPYNIAIATKRLKLKHVVITMVARDDLKDQGASHIAQIIKQIKILTPETIIETLTSDFSCRFELIDIVLNENVDVFNYNIETVKRLTPKIRDKATYKNTLKILKYVKLTKKTKFTKSGLMVGLGETQQEVFDTIKDLKEVNCDIITIGQYFAANTKKYKVKNFLSLKDFESYKKFAKNIGVKMLFAGPYVRSSYNAALIKDAILINN